MPGAVVTGCRPSMFRTVTPKIACRESETRVASTAARSRALDWTSKNRPTSGRATRVRNASPGIVSRRLSSMATMR
ncbi:MAG TPA: hypothetical protein VIK31_08915 [Propionibacteriaceae bacterium]